MFLKTPRSPASPPTYAMCFDPATIGLIATIGGAAISGIAAVQQGQAASAQANLQAGIQRQRADRERLEAAATEADFRARQSRAMAERRAGLGASGVDPAAGSPLLVSEDFAGEVELAALRIRTGGEVRATRLEQEATLNRFAGRAARRQGFVRGGALLVTGVGKSFGNRTPVPHEHD